MQVKSKTRFELAKCHLRLEAAFLRDFRLLARETPGDTLSPLSPSQEMIDQSGEAK